MNPYTFNTLANGNIEVMQNGQRISTGSAASAARYGYVDNSAPVAPNMSIAGSISDTNQYPTVSTPTPISVSSLNQPATPVTPPVKEGLSSNDYKALVDAAIAGAKTPAPTAPPAPTKAPTFDLNKRISELIGPAPAAPTSLADQYKQLQDQAGIAEKQKLVDDLTAQLNAIDAQNTAQNLSLENQGGQIVAGGVALAQAANNREMAIRTLPITAKLNAAQGILQSAQQNINTLMDLQYKDAQALKAYNDTLYQRAYAIATNEQQVALDEWKVRQDTAAKAQQDFINLKQTYVDAAIKNGDYSTAAELAGATDTNKLNTIVGGMKATTAEWGAPYTLGGDIVQKNSKTGEIRTAVNTPTGAGTGGSESVDYYAQLLGQGKISVSNVPQNIRNQVIVASQGVVNKPLSDTALTKINDTNFAISSLNDLRTKIQSNIGQLGPITGLEALNPWSEKKKLQADIDRVRQTVGKALEGGVLRKEDEEKYKKILATITDTPETALYKIDALISSIQGNIEDYKKLQSESGRYVPTSSTTSTPEDLRGKYNY